MLIILAAILLGVFAGIFTGLCPGIHINLVSVTLVSLAPILLQYSTPLSLCVFIIAMSVTHSFLDVIPSIFLGAPNDATALGVLPGHRYLLKGFGLMAVKLSIVGAYGGLLISIVFFPLFLLLVKYGYPLIEPMIGLILIAVCAFMLLREKLLLWALLIFLISGTLGLLVLNMPGLHDPLFPMLSGLFGVATLLISLNESQSIPEQKDQQDVELKPWVTVKALLSGQFSGFITAVMPGLGASTAAVLSLQVTRKLGDNGFMILMGSIGTVNFVLSISALWVMDKARNGSIIAVQQMIGSVGLHEVLVFLAAALISGSAAVFLVLTIGRFFSRMITRLPYNALCWGIICFMTALVMLLTGWLGLLVLLVSTAVGLIPAVTKVARTHTMACLLVPVILYFVL
jgi:putative membrane protein